MLKQIKYRLLTYKQIGSCKRNYKIRFNEFLFNSYRFFYKLTFFGYEFFFFIKDILLKILADGLISIQLNYVTKVKYNS